MPVYDLLALTPVQVAGLSARLASDNARTALDNAHAHLDATVPAGDLETGPTTVLDRHTLAGLLRLIRDDARSLRDGSALTRTLPAARIIERTDQLLKALGEEPNGATDEDSAAPADENLLRDLHAAIERARDLRDDPRTSLEARTQIQEWIKRAHAAQDAGDPATIRAILATPYAQIGGTP